MTTVTPPHWGERSYLYDKSLDYVFSLDIAYKVVANISEEPPAAPGGGEPHARPWNARIPMHADATDIHEVSTYRVLPGGQYDSQEHVKRDVPLGRVASARDWLTLSDDGAVPLDGRVLIDTEAPEPLVMAYTGVLNMSGGTAQMTDPKISASKTPLTGTAFIASQQEVSVPRYKWLVYSQLIGIGRVVAKQPNGANGRWHLLLSFDFYLGS
jgi:hypothetical protein